MYCAYVRPHLKYAAVVWSPHTKKDCNILEKVQRRATKLVPRLRNESYNHRLSVLRLTTDWTQEKRWYDPVLQDKQRHQQSRLDQTPSALQLGPAQGIRGHKRRMSGQRSTSCVQRENFFANRAVNEWNKLPATTISAETILFHQFYSATQTHLLLAFLDFSLCKFFFPC